MVPPQSRLGPASVPPSVPPQFLRDFMVPPQSRLGPASVLPLVPPQSLRDFMVPPRSRLWSRRSFYVTLWSRLGPASVPPLVPPQFRLSPCEDVAVGSQPSGNKKYCLKHMYHHSHLSDSDRCRLMLHLFFIQFSLGAKGGSLTLCAGSECSVRVPVCRLQLAGMHAGGLLGVAGL
jgi:hypothetical protein